MTHMLCHCHLWLWSIFLPLEEAPATTGPLSASAVQVALGFNDPSSPQDCWLWELGSPPWSLRCSRASTSWFSASSSSLASSKEIRTTGSSRSRTTNWPCWGPMTHTGQEAPAAMGDVQS